MGGIVRGGGSRVAPVNWPFPVRPVGRRLARTLAPL